MAVSIAVFSIVAFLLAYRFYGTFIQDQVLGIDPNRVTPSHELEDGVDFVPTNKFVLFGHHLLRSRVWGRFLGQPSRWPGGGSPRLFGLCSDRSSWGRCMTFAPWNFRFATKDGRSARSPRG
ncbi:MAG: hypothetical protein KC944_03625 [Candidatus Omnitrophica bacterium]|nr:hypothetical protein [Candidatus Omnitrophota bacterium]